MVTGSTLTGISCWKSNQLVISKWPIWQRRRPPSTVHGTAFEAFGWWLHRRGAHRFPAFCWSVTRRCFYRAMHYSASAVLRSHVVCLSVCPSVTLVDHNHIGWKSWKLIERTISPTSSLFVAQRSSTYYQGNMEKFWGENVCSIPTSITSGWIESTESHVILGVGMAVSACLFTYIGSSRGHLCNNRTCLFTLQVAAGWRSTSTTDWPGRMDSTSIRLLDVFTLPNGVTEESCVSICRDMRRPASTPGCCCRW